MMRLTARPSAALRRRLPARLRSPRHRAPFDRCTACGAPPAIAGQSGKLERSAATPASPSFRIATICYTSFIKSKTALFFSEAEVGHIVEAVQQGRLPATWKTHREHVASLRERHGSNVCPKCGSSLVARVAKTGGNAGKPFPGCSIIPVAVCCALAQA